ncbi:hypothetical protein [Paenibacillus sp. N3.4]|uniref:hypothetical protein n=1 Tax=Paenibacillus sp. N3.4 TaxID=2603222 RepID=UPI0011CC0057|nr:hypothetical protein [Paenibacillus sp. N3.4]TXK76902.1 hypothetical protein FU659_24285 [Paenibacillus sp. N3.4]
MAEMTDRKFLSAIMERLNEIGADVKTVNDHVESIDRRLTRVEERLDRLEELFDRQEANQNEMKQLQMQQSEQLASIAVTMMEHAASIRTLKLVK